jgi:uncharacterized membrane protein YidH (DUF202 family)
VILDNYRDRSKFIKRLIFWSIVIGGIFALFFAQTVAHAQTINLCDSSQQNSLGGCISGLQNYSTDTTQNNVTKFVLDIVRFLVYIGAGIAVLFIVLGGFNMITSNGNADQYKKGLNTLVYAIIGLVVAIVAVTIVALVSSIVTNIQIGS